MSFNVPPKGHIEIIFGSISLREIEHYLFLNVPARPPARFWHIEEFYFWVLWDPKIEYFIYSMRAIALIEYFLSDFGSCGTQIREGLLNSLIIGS